jgi:hypothetical protein
VARLAKWIPASCGGSRGRANASRFFDVLKGASLRVARSDCTAARVLFIAARALGDAMLSEATDG